MLQTGLLMQVSLQDFEACGAEALVEGEGFADSQPAHDGEAGAIDHCGSQASPLVEQTPGLGQQTGVHIFWRQRSCRAMVAR